MSNKNLAHDSASVESANELEAKALEHEAKADEHGAKAKLLRAKAIRQREAEKKTPTPAEPPRMLTAAEIAKRLGVSVATIRRLDPPGLVVGHERTKRYDLEEVRAWLAEREPKATTPTKKIPKVEPNDDVDVSDVIEGSGLRLAGGSS